MPTSQNSRELLAYLNTIGSADRGDKATMKHTAKALVELAAFLMDEATANMDKTGATAPGDTLSSMKAVNIDLQGTKMGIDIEINSTYKFIDQGVRGVEGGTGKYQFKTKRPSKKMAQAILRWAKKRALGGKIKYKAVSKQERKNKSINKVVSEAKSRESLSYAIATNIKKRGIKPTKFFSKAVSATKKLQKEKYAQALKLDIIESLNNN